jgi:hypothetical protein
MKRFRLSTKIGNSGAHFCSVSPPMGGLRITFGQIPELRMFRQWLARERVQRGAGDPIFFQRLYQQLLFYRLATCELIR